MTWLRLDDAFRQHPKILALTPSQRWTWVDTMLWAATYSETTGLLPEIADRAVPGLGKLRPRLRELGLIDVRDESDEVHDYLLYTSASIETKVEWCHERYPDATANDIYKKIGGNRKQVVEAVRIARETRTTPHANGRETAETEPVPIRPGKAELEPHKGGSNSANSPRAHVRGPSRPVPTTRERAAAAEETPHANNTTATTAAAELLTLLTAAKYTGPDLHSLEPDRALAWLRRGHTSPSVQNVAGFYRRGMEQPGVWPEPTASDTTSRTARPLYDTLATWIRNTGHEETPDGLNREIEDRERRTSQTLTTTERAQLVNLWATIADPEPTPADTTTTIPTTKP